MATKSKNETCAIIMMAGKGTRMKSDIPKVLHSACGRSMGQWVINSCEKAGIKDRVVVVGHLAEIVSASFPGENFVLQEPQNGTGHAVMLGYKEVPKTAKFILVLSGDVPCLSASTIKALIGFHKSEKNSATVLSFHPLEPTGYGRIIRDDFGKFLSIVEQKELSHEESHSDECNSGIYVFNYESLGYALKLIKPNKKSGEYHLPDAIKILADKNEKVEAIPVEEWMEAMGVNSKTELCEASDFLRWRIAYEHMDNGVTIIDPANTWIGPDVKIGRDATIMPGSIIMGRTKIGEGCVIGPYTQITDAHIGLGCIIRQSVLLDCQIDDDVTIGPFAHVRPGSRMRRGSHIGNFVELKKTDFGEESKSGHLTYLGDAKVGKHVNIGAGTITCNFDGTGKYDTVIGDNTFVGSDTILVAPIKIASNAYTAAGSTLTKQVDEFDLALGRARQVNKPGWVKRRISNKKK